MKKTLKKKWIAALRSGKYKQGTGFLRDKNNRYCCLGVLASVDGCKWQSAKSNQFAGAYALKGAIHIYPGETHDFRESVGIFTPDYMKKVGLDSDTMDTLTSMNDDEDKDFDQIADYIEGEL